MGKFDQPAQITAILSCLPDYDKLTYVGYSQGTTQMFSALSEGHGNLRNQITEFIALAPVVKFNYSDDSFIKLLKDNVTALNRALWMFNIEFIGGPDYFCSSFLRNWIDNSACEGRSDLHTASRE